MTRDSAQEFLGVLKLRYFLLPQDEILVHRQPLIQGPSQAP